MCRTFSFILFVFASVALLAQKKPLTIDDFNQWKSISNIQLSKDGVWALWQIEPQEGDGNLYLYNTQTSKIVTFKRGSNARLTSDNRFLVLAVKPTYESVRTAKRKKVKKEDLPKDHLVIYTLATAKTDTVKNIENFSMPAEEGNWVAITRKVEEEAKEKTAPAEKPKATTNGNNTAQKTEPAKQEKPKKPKMVETVRLMQLDGEGSLELKKVDKTYFPEYARVFYYLREKGDSLNPKGFYRLPLQTLMPELIDSTFKGLTNVRMNKRGTLVTYLTTPDSAKADLRTYTLKLFDGAKSKIILEKGTPGMPNSWMPSPDFRTVIDENKRYMLVGTKPIPTQYPKDTLAIEEESVKLDIWHWQDDDIQPYQLKNKKQREEKSYLGRIDMTTMEFKQLADEAVETSGRFRDTVGTWVVGNAEAEYKRESSWISPNYRDLYLINIATGERRLVKKHVRANLSLSPEEGYAYWYDRQLRHWFAYDLDDGRSINLTANIEFAMWDEDNDVPDDPQPYGSVGWIGDSLFVVRDRFDLWGIRPQNTINPVCLTGGKGRATNTVFSVEVLDREAKQLPKTTWLLTTFNRETKQEGVATLDVQNKALTVLAEPDDYAYQQFVKAKNANVVLFRKGNFQEFPDVYVSDLSLQAPKKITNANTQQSKFLWGTVELIEWKGYQGAHLQGLLYKPQDFDATKKYPMIVYFYERSSDELNSYRMPTPSASTINIPQYISNGYVVFMPDIVYEVGNPGGSAFDCIISGTKKLVKESWVDETRIGLQGQSWGGYQVAWLITQTDMFACAMSGAPVSNMTSAYGGIRWGTGVSREFQYERQQSRIGKTLWEDRDAYIENSPVFFADNVQTPLLMMHNDEDGAVPWYQAIEYFMALRRLNKPVWLLVYNGEDHNLTKRHNKKDLTLRMAQFFDHYLKDAPAPEWLEKGRPAIEKDKNPATRMGE